MEPFNDKIKVKIETKRFGGSASGRVSGVVTKVPDDMIYFGFHSFLADNTIGNLDVLQKVQQFYKKLEGKIVFWEALQDRGRMFKEGDEEFVLLNMSDIIGWTDDLDADIQIIDQTGSAGAFNLE